MAGKRLYYKIGEACKLLEIQPYVLRYWETEFPVLEPNKSRSGQRVYSEKDLALIRRIKELLYNEGYTIAGAKRKLESEIEAGGPASTDSPKPAKAAESKKAPKKAKKTPQPTLDTSGAERIQILREGIERALGEAQDILSLLKR